MPNGAEDHVVKCSRFLLSAPPPLVFLLLAGCARPVDPVEFNDALAWSNRQLADSAVKFRAKLDPIEQGKPVDAEGVQSTYNDVQKVFNQVQADLSKLKPKESTSMQEFYEAYETYLAGEEKFIKEDLKTVRDIALDTQTSNEAKKTEIANAFKRIKNVEEENLKVLRAAQQKYANDMKIRAIPDRVPDKRK